jgi:hypothetical protein
VIESLDMHILDLFQNALASGASEITIRIDCRSEEDTLTMEISDNGRGMDAETLAAVERGTYSSKCERCVGLGLPLLRATAEQCGGRFKIQSHPGEGTTVTATMERTHIDLPPFEDLAETLLALLVTSGGRRVRLLVDCRSPFELDTDELDAALGGIVRTHPDVIAFLRNFLAERLGQERRSR